VCQNTSVDHHSHTVAKISETLDMLDSVKAVFGKLMLNRKFHNKPIRWEDIVQRDTLEVLGI
jgi:hypothetical protein